MGEELDGGDGEVGGGGDGVVGGGEVVWVKGLDGVAAEFVVVADEGVGGDCGWCLGPVVGAGSGGVDGVGGVAGDGALPGVGGGGEADGVGLAGGGGAGQDGEFAAEVCEEEGEGAVEGSAAYLGG